jgi:hypothetical protein
MVMKPIHRTLAGMGIAAILLPVLIGVLACLPVPIGNPEKSRIDPEMSGVWFDVFDETLWLIQPYDRRTYLITLYAFRPVDCDAPRDERPDEGAEESSGHDEKQGAVDEGIAASEEEHDAAGESDFEIEDIVISPRYRPESYDGDVDADDALAWYKDFVIAVRQDCGSAEATRRETHKAWLTELGGADFLTLEPAGIFDDKANFGTDAWFVWRFTRPNSAALELELVNYDFQGFKKIEKTRKAYESAIRKHANDPDLTEDNPLLLLRVPRHDLEFFADSIEPDPTSVLQMLIDR